MFYFVVPMISKRVASDWNFMNTLLHRTLLSVLAQTDENWRAIVVGNEKPTTPLLSEERIDFLSVETELKADTPGHRDYDKEKKLRAAYVHIRPSHPDFVMILDADDLVNRDLVKYVRSHPCEAGFVVQDGYVYVTRHNRMRRVDNFNTRCGSSLVVKYRPEWYPESNDVRIHDYWTMICHPRLSCIEDRTLTFSELPFPASIYVRHDGGSTRDSARVKQITKRYYYRLRESVLAFAKGKSVNEEHMKMFGGLEEHVQKKPAPLEEE